MTCNKSLSPKRKKIDINLLSFVDELTNLTASELCNRYNYYKFEVVTIILYLNLSCVLQSQKISFIFCYHIVSTFNV